MAQGRELGHHVGAARIRAIDPLRGLAMVLVIVQHAYHFVDPAVATGWSDLLVYGVTRLALVAFVGLSGTMLAYFLLAAQHGAAHRSPRQVTTRYARRALFLLLFAHPAIQITRMLNLDAPELGVAGQLVHRLLYDFPITDTIALCLLIAPPLLLRLGGRGGVVFAIGLLVATVGVLVLWHPASALGWMAESVLFGTTGPDPLISVSWPLVPWLGVFLLGAWPGRMLARARGGEAGLSEIVGSLLRTSGWLFATGVVLVSGYKLLRITSTGVIDESVFRVLYPDCTTGLLPFYLCVLAVMLAALLWHVDLNGRYDRVLWALSVLGRTSLFTYVVQFVFVHSLPAAWGLRHHLDGLGVTALAVGALVVTWWIAYAYGRARGWIAEHDYAEQRALGRRTPLAPERT